MKNCGLILEGGANRGIFTSGVLDCFQENNIYLPYVLAVSVGSCNALDYVSKQIGRTKSCFIPKGNITPPIHIKHILSVKNIINFDLEFNTFPNKLIPFNYDSYFESGITCEYVITNCLTGKAEYLSETKNKEMLMNICKASCSMPYICSPVVINNTPYLDGGVADAVPIRHSIEKGFKKNIIVLTRQSNYSKKSNNLLYHINKKLYLQFPNLVPLLNKRIDNYNKLIAYAESLEKSGDVLIIRPEKVIVNRLEHNLQRMEEFYAQGYGVAKQLLPRIKQFLDNSGEYDG